jgi:hypothetical protein
MRTGPLRSPFALSLRRRCVQERLQCTAEGSWQRDWCIATIAGEAGAWWAAHGGAAGKRWNGRRGRYYKKTAADAGLYWRIHIRIPLCGRRKCYAGAVVSCGRQVTTRPCRCKTLVVVAAGGRSRAWCVGQQTQETVTEQEQERIAKEKGKEEGKEEGKTGKTQHTTKIKPSAELNGPGERCNVNCSCIAKRNKDAIQSPPCTFPSDLYSRVTCIVRLTTTFQPADMFHRARAGPVGGLGRGHISSPLRTCETGPDSASHSSNNNPLFFPPTSARPIHPNCKFRRSLVCMQHLINTCS